jgi:hypothetical protein
MLFVAFADIGHNVSREASEQCFHGWLIAPHGPC